MKNQITPQFRVMLAYLCFGLLWIYLSDRVLAAVFTSPAHLTFAQNVKGWAFIGITAALLYVWVKRDFDALDRANRELLESYEQTIFAWAHLLDLRHKETKTHTDRVTRMTVELARKAGITDEESLRNIERGAILHDIGKIGIPDAILLKPDKLDEKEWILMKKHPTLGHELLAKTAFLQPSTDIPYYHHEKWNGQGYPRGLKGDAIPIAARIFAVIDVWDALCHPRVYKAAWPEEKALALLREEAGQHFDPEIVRLFVTHYDEIKAAALSGKAAEPTASKPA